MLRRLRLLLVPSRYELIGYLLSSLIFVTFAGLFSHFFLTDSQEKQLNTDTANYVHSLVSGFTTHTLTGVDKLPHATTITTFVVWFVIGLGVASLLSAALKTYGEIHNEVEVSVRYIHPRNFSTMRFWFGLIKRFVLEEAGPLILLVICGYLLITLLPLSLINAYHLFIWKDIVTTLEEAGRALIQAFFGIASFGLGYKLLFFSRDL